MVPAEPLTLAWRKARIDVGDEYLAEAERYGEAGHYSNAMLAVAIAQAHYAAANVRATETRPPVFRGGDVGTRVIGGNGAGTVLG